MTTLWGWNMSPLPSKGTMPSRFVYIFSYANTFCLLFFSYNNGLISLPDFELLKYLEKHVSAEKSDQKSNWLHGLQVAGHFLKQHFLLNPNSVESLKIAMISDLGCPLEDDKLFDEILETLKNDEISFVFM